MLSRQGTHVNSRRTEEEFVKASFKPPSQLPVLLSRCNDLLPEQLRRQFSSPADNIGEQSIDAIDGISQAETNGEQSSANGQKYEMGYIIFKDAQVVLPAKCALRQNDHKTSLTEVERLRGNDENETDFTCISLASDAGDVANTSQQLTGIEECISGVPDTLSTNSEVFRDYAEEMSSGSRKRTPRTYRKKIVIPNELKTRLFPLESISAGETYISTMELNSSNYVRITYYKREVEYTLTVSQCSISSAEKTYLKINVNFNFDQIAALATSRRDIYLQLSEPPFVSIEAMQSGSERNTFVRIPLTEQMVNVGNSIKSSEVHRITLKKAEGRRFSQRLTSFDDGLKRRMIYVAPGKGAFYVVNDLPCPAMDSLASDNSDI
ncbi:hypothetical protein M514_15353 [Trichuris suis]|uniref:Uncharacterized protein n=1 Tax=Trichuris suis TaxID=68888 RepID=A0A085NSS1_9BILA|nr:hypothetical protein M514_15353 [Trichuris suis]